MKKNKPYFLRKIKVKIKMLSAAIFVRRFKGLICKTTGTFLTLTPDQRHVVT